jgi:hypothetical protein
MLACYLCPTASRGSVCHTLPSLPTLHARRSFISSSHPPRNQKDQQKYTKCTAFVSTSLPLRYLNFLLPYSPPAFSSINCIPIFFSLFLNQGTITVFPFSNNSYPTTPMHANNKTTMAITTTTMSMTSPVNESAAPIMSNSRLPSLPVV